ncbi:MAG: methyltransferase domain-containing protein [Ignavibacteria bacterium]|nr:methyltransferase domain-containing protein [Ignavibacteria bacterium]
MFEIGSGTGCISISLAKNLEKANISYDIFSIDISKDAIEVAAENLSANKLSDKKVTFYRKDVFEIEKLTKSFDYIVSNPPYISKTDYDSLEPGIKDFEPGFALTDSGDGLKFYKKIFMVRKKA